MSNIVLETALISPNVFMLLWKISKLAVIIDDYHVKYCVSNSLDKTNDIIGTLPTANYYDNGHDDKEHSVLDLASLDGENIKQPCIDL